MFKNGCEAGGALHVPAHWSCLLIFLCQTTGMEIRVLSNAEAIERMRTNAFAEAWGRLCAACPWATGYQSPEFILPWYECYADTAAPLLLVAEGADQGELQGLLALAVDRDSGQLFNAGAHQAEYHCWLALEGQGDQFITVALARMRELYPKGQLQFRYLPPNCPEGWLDGPGGWQRLTGIRPIPRPLMVFESEDAIDAKLRKKGNKSRLKRLRAACGGELTGSTVRSEAELAGLIEEIASNYDHRQGAMNEVRPFGDDARKKDFHLRLLRSGVLHAFVLRAGESMVAAILSVKSTGFLSVGILSHADALAEHSPGKFGMLYLAREALRQGFGAIDLTPGGKWKDRFASQHDTVSELTVRFSAVQARIAALRGQALASTKQVLAAAGVTPQDIRRFGGRLLPGANRHNQQSRARKAS